MLGPLLPGHGRLFFSLFLYSFKVVVRAFKWGDAYIPSHLVTQSQYVQHHVNILLVHID